MIVWRLGGKIIRTVVCCVVYDSCAQWYAHTCEQFLNLHVCLGLDFVFVCSGLAFCVFLCYLISFHNCLACFCCVGFSTNWYFRTKPRDWLGRVTLKWAILCRMGHKTLTQSISQSLCAVNNRVLIFIVHCCILHVLVIGYQRPPS